MKEQRTIALLSFSILLLIAFFPIQSFANDRAYPSSSNAAKSIESDVSEILLQRLNEINAIDKSNLKAAEKKVLRKEARSIKQVLKRRGRVAIPVGAVLLLAILIIIFF